MKKNSVDVCMSYWSNSVRLAIAIFVAGIAGCSNHDPDSTFESSRAALNANPQTPNFAVYAHNSATLRDRVLVTNGDVGVRLAGTGPFIGGSYELVLASEVKVDLAKSTLANRVQLFDRARLGDVQVNQIINQNGFYAQKYPFPTTMPALPPLAPVTPGTAPLTVGMNSTLVASPGSYGVVSIGSKGILRLKSGVYQIASLLIGNEARIEVQGPVQLRVAGRLLALDRIFIGAAIGVAIAAGDIRIEVAGRNGNSGSLMDSPKAAVFGNDAKVTAVLLAPNGSLLSGQRAIVVGAYMARDIYIDIDSKINFQSGVGPSGCLESCDDANPCTEDSCSVGVCVHTIRSAGSSCDDGNACNGAEKCDGAGQCMDGTPVVCSASDQCHVVGTCDPTTGACSNPASADGTVCNDGNLCTNNDLCQTGLCVGTAYNCNDGLDCTSDSCNGDGTCQNLIAAGNCAINHACYTHGASNPADSCQICNAGNPMAWSSQADGTTCSSFCSSVDGGVEDGGMSSDDGGVCVSGNICISGQCKGICVPGARQCTGLTPQVCDATGTWQNEPSCDDGNSCTTDSCLAGVCGHGLIPKGTSCTSGNACSTGHEACDGTGQCLCTCTGTDIMCNGACYPACQGGKIFDATDCTCKCPPNPAIHGANVHVYYRRSFGGHNCNYAQFKVNINGVAIDGDIDLNNSPGGGDRDSYLTVTAAQMTAAAATRPIKMNFVCKYSYCHPNVGYVVVTDDTTGATLFEGFQDSAVLKLDTCF